MDRKFRAKLLYMQYNIVKNSEWRTILPQTFKKLVDATSWNLNQDGTAIDRIGICNNFNV